MELFSGSSLIQLVQTIGLIGVVAIIFAETGLLIGFFLPGDSLLFTAGILASQGIFNIYVLVPALFCASVVGNLVGYYLGKHIGPRLFSKPDSFLFHREHIERTKRFFAHHGGKTIILARFIPIIRTFAPILAGVGSMDGSRFFLHSIIGGILWAALLTILGFALGRAVPDVDKYLLPIIGVIIILSFLPALFHRKKH
ncbi:MAG: VTT domain-containing protein [Patescibacteria group bacterium]